MNRFAKRRSPLLPVLALSFALAACGGGGGGGGSGSGATAFDFDSEVATAWFDVTMDLIRTAPGFSPPVASRALGYLGVAMYETVQPGMPGYNSLGGVLSNMPPLPEDDDVQSAGIHWPAAVNAALASLNRKLFPNAPQAGMDAIDQLEANLAAQYQGEASPDVYQRSVERGQLVAEVIHNWSLTDGGAFGYLTNGSPGYVPPAGPGLWEPTPPGFAPALQANWGNNRTMCLPSGESCSPGFKFPAYSTDPASAFYAEAVEVRNTVNSLTAEQMEIANFWADGPATYTPPGHWFSILKQVMQMEGSSLGTAAEAYSRLGIAACDAFISCWKAKYTTNLLRPITYIQDNLQAGWQSFIGTPPFPEFSSGHSTISGAASVILTDLFGENYAFTDNAPGFAPRTFSSFREAAEEAAISRLYGGIHYRSGISIGVEQGRMIGQAVNALPYRPRGGPSGPPASEYPATVAHAWFDFTRDLIRTTPGFSPPVASRALGYIGVALHEATVHGVPGRESLAGKLNDLTPLPRPLEGMAYHWPSVANAALAEAVRSFFPNASSQNMQMLDIMKASIADGFLGAAPSEVLERSAALGDAIAEGVRFWSYTDGGDLGYASNFPSNYTPPAGPGLWVPTLPAFAPALQPYWGSNRPLALPSGGARDPGPPPPFSTSTTSAFYLEALACKEAVDNLTQEQADVADWWADGGNTFTPPGHSIAIATQALQMTNARLDKAALTYAMVGVGVCDAFISCWHAKYKYNLLRPITYIQDHIAPGWIPYIATPPFPEYTSGHSAQSGASGHILTVLFGSNFAFTDTTNATLLPSIGSRSFSSFMDAANEAAISRLYGGIHFPSAIFAGVQQGVEVGKHVIGVFGQ